ncbi:MAG: aldehyde ferredoxin oxidoreductase N-terminal domain-containing protein [Thermodesulfobacteriota bacterium]
MKSLYGWTGKILRVDLSDRKISQMETADYSERFIGGKGIGEKIYWDETSPEIDAFHPDNRFIVMTGPLAATTAPSGSRWLVCGKSPMLYPENFVSTNLGGFLGASLKRAGYDGIVIQGKADQKVYLSIENEKVEIKDASHLWGLTTGKTMELIRNELGDKVTILTTGPAGENAIRLSTMITDTEGSGTMGFGAVMGSKNLKAIAVRGSGKIPVADPDRVTQIRQQVKIMTGEGYFNLYGNPAPLSEVEPIKQVRCNGCPQGCWRYLYKADSGEEGIRKCQAAFFYSLWDKNIHGDTTKVSFLATSLVNEYSLCTMEFAGILVWLERCFKEGILSEKETEIPLSQMGTLEFLETIVKKISYREGFGNILAEGIMRAADAAGKEAKEVVMDHFTQTGRGIAYGPKVFSPAALIYATEPRPPTTELHELCEPLTKWALWYTTNGTFTYLSTDVMRKIAKRFWGSEEAVDFSTYDGKALAAVKIQNRQHAKETLILCDFAWPIYDAVSTEDHVGDSSLESQLLSAVIGKEVDEAELDLIGERVFNLNRAILLRDGRKARKDDFLPESQFIEREEPRFDVFVMFNPDLFLPGSGDEIISRKGKALDKNKFEQMKDEYYKIRGWDVATGLLKRDKLESLNLQDLIDPLKEKVLP